jgi:hypothetical protein
MIQRLVCILFGHDYANVELVLGKLDPKKVNAKQCERCHKVLIAMDEIGFEPEDK